MRQMKIRGNVYIRVYFNEPKFVLNLNDRGLVDISFPILPTFASRRQGCTIGMHTHSAVYTVKMKRNTTLFIIVNPFAVGILTLVGSKMAYMAVFPIAKYLKIFVL